MPLQKGDMINTKSNINKINKLIKIRAGVNLKYGLTKFIEWYYEYYKVKI